MICIFEGYVSRKKGLYFRARNVYNSLPSQTNFMLTRTVISYNIDEVFSVVIAVDEY